MTVRKSAAFPDPQKLNPPELELSSCLFFFSSRRRHTRFDCDWSSDVCSSDLVRVLSHPDLEYLDAIRLQGEGAPWHALEVDDHSHPLAGCEQQRAARLRVRQIALLARDLSEIDRCRAEMQVQVAVETTVHDSKQVLARLDAEVRPGLAVHDLDER